MSTNEHRGDAETVVQARDVDQVDNSTTVTASGNSGVVNVGNNNTISGNVIGDR